MPIFENFSDSYLSRSIKIKSKLHVHDSFLAAPPLLSLVKIKLHVSQVTPLHSLSDSQTKCTFFSLPLHSPKMLCSRICDARSLNLVFRLFEKRKNV